MNTAFLSLGGNLGDRRENLRRAVNQIEQHCGEIEKTSSIYETAPWGSSSSKQFLNMVVKISTALSMRELIERVLMIEEKLGRKRNGAQNSDRLIDIDILFYNKVIRASKGLQVPHPRIQQRRFVLVPMSEIEPDFVHPQLKKNMKTLLKACNDELSVKKILHKPPCSYICIEGNLGSGKTTLAKALARQLRAELLLERFEENHLLPLFYKKPKKFAFPLEYSFLIGRFDQIKGGFAEKPALTLADYTFSKSLWFARVNLKKKEFEMFSKHFAALLPELRQPDLLVYLETEPENLIANIRNRGRIYEQNIGAEYLKAIEKSYRWGFKQLKIPILRLKVKDYDKEPEKELCRKILQYLRENFG